ncbi:MAG TPA: hypothetical protein VFP61_00690 [Acidimicrobiales bacterium]|nr:hypothetical protein [Acidimicrobiales bacterium]
MQVAAGVAAAVGLVGGGVALGLVIADRPTRSAAHGVPAATSRPGPSASSPAATIGPGSVPDPSAPGPGPATTAPGTSSGGLGAEVPASFRADCTASVVADYLDPRAGGQVVCSGASVPDADSVVYLQYPQSQQADDFYSASLLQGNGLAAGVGDCAGLGLTVNAASGSYCENPVTSTAGEQTGSQFVFQGTNFALGNGNDVADLCAGGDQTRATAAAFTVFGWTDDPTDLAAVAVTCSTDNDTVKAIEGDFLAGRYDLTGGAAGDGAAGGGTATAGG